MEIVKRIQALHTTSPSTEGKVKYSCPICKDAKMIQNSNGTWSECQCQIKERISRLWENFGVKPDDVKKLNDYVPYDKRTKEAKEKAVEYIKRFDEIRQEKENSFGLFGQAGAGKSHIVIAMGVALLSRDKYISVVYMPYLEAMRELKANSMDDEYYIKLSNRYNQAPLLIIDDLFKDKVRNGQIIRDRYNQAGLNEADMKHIMPIINYRYVNNLPTLISTECTPDMLYDLDEALAGRILERCGSNMVVFKGEQYNYRMKKFLKAKAKTQI